MSEQLELGRVRSILIRLEETIIFSLIERAQYGVNPPVYVPGHFGAALEGHSLAGFLLLECERSHAKVRRYTSPDEHPFFDALPEPVLPALPYAANPLRPNAINLNPRIRHAYEQDIIPRICLAGDDGQYGSAAVCDVTCLQALSKRIHYGKFVAESKYRDTPERFDRLAATGDAAALLAAITDTTVEAAVIERVTRKTATFTSELRAHGGSPGPAPEVIAGIFRDWIIPLNKDVQVRYLLSAAPATTAR